jgi:hypothetical protein
MTKGWAYVGLLVAGGMLGAAIGLLAAPAPGHNTRRRIRQWIDEDATPQTADLYSFGMDDVYPLGMEALPAPQAVWQ